MGILTTGFDVPTIETIILNRATKSLTLYHQLIGRGSRILKDKKEFTVIDLGNNALRFGLWDTDIDWQEIFVSPYKYYQSLSSDYDIERQFKYKMPESLRIKFANSSAVEFDIKEAYKGCLTVGMRPINAIDSSIQFFSRIIFENAEDVYDGRMLVVSGKTIFLLHL